MGGGGGERGEGEIEVKRWKRGREKEQREREGERDSGGRKGFTLFQGHLSSAILLHLADSNLLHTMKAKLSVACP